LLLRRGITCRRLAPQRPAIILRAARSAVENALGVLLLFDGWPTIAIHVLEGIAEDFFCSLSPSCILARAVNRPLDATALCALEVVELVALWSSA
jgi:hypothetical protein